MGQNCIGTISLTAQSLQQSRDLLPMQNRIFEALQVGVGLFR
ncbi:hypothetical protein PCLA_21r0072 [Pseudomonas citronellolis]|nr:hypothetical protein PCLA_21r0072 [Pseudomonas citronellolis]